MNANISNARAWAIVAMLCGMVTFSMLDRMIPALMVSALHDDLGVSPLQFGLLVGTGFGALYAIVGIPTAQLIDRGNRKWVLAVGILLWSAATIASGFAADFSHLLIARAGVAIGEAALTPAAISMIGDLFPAERRTRPTTAYLATGQIMGAGLFLLAAGALALAALVAPLLGLSEWRTAFLLVGLCPLALGVLWIFAAREPKRDAIAQTTERHETIAGALRYLHANTWLYLCLYLAVGLANMIAFALISWLPAILTQSHGLSMAQAGASMGLSGVVTCGLGASLSPALSVRLQCQGLHGGPMLVAAAMIAIAITGLALGVTSDNTAIVIGAFGIGTFGLAGFIVMPPMIIQWIAPALLRGRLTAINQFAVNAIGLAAGPPLVALFAANVLGNETAIAPALALLAMVAGLPAICLLLAAQTGFARAHAESPVSLRQPKPQPEPA